MSDQNQDRWVDVLAGRQPATDRETRQADSIRRLHLREMAEDAQPLDDPQRTKRLLNLLEAEGLLKSREEQQAAERRTADASTAPQGLVARAMAWLFPAESRPMRLGLVAGALAAVLVIPLLVRQPAEDDPQQMRSAPPGLQIPAPDSAVAVLPDVRVADPLAAASQAQTALRRASIEGATVSREGQWAVLRLTVAPGQTAQASAALQAWGINVPPGASQITFKPR